MLRKVDGKIKKNEILISYRCKAYLVDGLDKLFLIEMICSKNTSEAIYNYVKSLFKPIEEDIYNIVIEICDDLLNGMNILEVEKKKYGYTYEDFFYVDKNYFKKNLKNDKHYSEMKILKFDI